MTVEAQFGIAKGGYRGAPTLEEVKADVEKRGAKSLSWNEIYNLNYNPKENSTKINKRKRAK